jgi:polysaccharide deacetylase 2 family uncharacterized protein YibQ
LALVGGIAIGVIVSTLLELAEPPPVEMALRLPKPQPQASNAPPAPPAPAPITPSSPPADYEPPAPEMAEPPAMAEEPSPTVEEAQPPVAAQDQTINAPPAESAVLPPEPAPPTEERPVSPPQIAEPASPPVSSPPAESAALPPEPRTPAIRQPEVPPSVAPSEIRPEAELPAWRRYAVAVPDVDGRALIAIVIDDMGVDQRHSAEAIDLPGPLTLSFLPYAHDLARQTAAAHRHGHELLVHIPMQPLDDRNNPGPNALRPDLAPDEIKRRLDLALSAFTGYVGVNNHMGSRFTRDRAGMDVVMAELAARGLLFLDSRTISHSLGASTAAAHHVPHAGRHVFLDNELAMTEVCRQLAETERIARESGLAIAIGHPHAVTIAALKAWLPTLADKGFALVPVSKVVERLRERRGVTRTAAPAGH